MVNKLDKAMRLHALQELGVELGALFLGSRRERRGVKDWDGHDGYCVGGLDSRYLSSEMLTLTMDSIYTCVPEAFDPIYKAPDTGPLLSSSRARHNNNPCKWAMQNMALLLSTKRKSLQGTETYAG